MAAVRHLYVCRPCGWSGRRAQQSGTLPCPNCGSVDICLASERPKEPDQIEDVIYIGKETCDITLEVDCDNSDEMSMSFTSIDVSVVPELLKLINQFRVEKE